VKPGEPEPNTVSGFGLSDQTGRRTFDVRHKPESERPVAPDTLADDTHRPRPRRAATRTLAEARALGLSMPEALDLTPEEVRNVFGEPPESA
jgi:hypothetical protein